MFEVILKCSRKNDFIYRRVGPCMCHAHVNRLERILEGGFWMSFVTLAFNCSYCHAVVIGLEQQLRIGV